MTGGGQAADPQTQTPAQQRTTQPAHPVRAHRVSSQPHPLFVPEDSQPRLASPADQGTPTGGPQKGQSRPYNRPTQPLSVIHRSPSRPTTGSRPIRNHSGSSAGSPSGAQPPGQAARGSTLRRGPIASISNPGAGGRSSGRRRPTAPNCGLSSPDTGSRPCFDWRGVHRHVTGRTRDAGPPAFRVLRRRAARVLRGVLGAGVRRILSRTPRPSHWTPA